MMIGGMMSGINSFIDARKKRRRKSDKRSIEKMRMNYFRMQFHQHKKYPDEGNRHIFFAFVNNGLDGDAERFQFFFQQRRAGIEEDE